MEEITMEGHNPFLPEDIIIDILKRLPVKSLIRFQCVCKHWKNLLRTPSFITEHLHHSRNENSSLILQWDFKCDPLHLHMLNHKMQFLEVQPSPFMNSLSWTTFVGCSNGLLCVVMDGPGNSLQSILVWNPATREFRQVPSPINLDGGRNYFFARGFGFSPIINDYKILISYDILIDCQYFPLEVYSLSTGSWKEIEVDDLGALFLNGLPVTVNGVFFWYGNTIPTDDNDVTHIDVMIVSFDIATEKFTFIPLPFSFNSYDRGLLTVHENRIALLSSNVIGNNESSMTDLWVMEELAGGTFVERWGWCKKYSISTSPSAYPRGVWLDKIVYINRELPKYGESELDADNGMINVLYLLNLSTNELVNFVPGQRGDQVWVIFDYVESLMPLSTSTHLTIDPTS